LIFLTRFSEKWDGQYICFDYGNRNVGEIEESEDGSLKQLKVGEPDEFLKSTLTIGEEVVPEDIYVRLELVPLTSLWLRVVGFNRTCLN
jgi:hypothetical protein